MTLDVCRGETATQALASLAQLRPECLPSHVQAVAAQCVLDTIGVMVAGAGEPAVQKLTSVLSGDGSSTLVGQGQQASQLDAALVNGTAAHALDFDDVSAPMTGHPSAPVLPAVLALGESIDASGRDVLTAFVAGIEAEIRLAVALGRSHYEMGFHTTATAGTVGAAVACANLLRLTEVEACHAIGIAATQSAGLKSMFGSDSKPLHAGKAAQSGLFAALLAQRGFTAAGDGIGGAQGLAATHSTTWDPAALSAARERDVMWYTPDILFKVHAACYLTHASIEGALRLTEDVSPADVDAIQLVVPSGHLRVCAIDDPASPLEGKFSLRFVVALAAIRRRATEDLFTETSIADPEVRGLMDKVTIVPDETMPTFLSRVTVRIDGHERSLVIDVNRRAWDDSPQEQTEVLMSKFHTLTDGRLTSQSSDVARRAIGLGHEESVRDLLASLALT